MRNATISFVISVCPSHCMEQICSHLNAFVQKYLIKSVERIRVCLKSYKNDNQFACILLLQSLTVTSFDKWHWNFSLYYVRADPNKDPFIAESECVLCEVSSGAKETAQHQYRLKLLWNVFCASHELRLKKESSIEYCLKLRHTAFCAQHDLRSSWESSIVRIATDCPVQSAKIITKS